MAKRIKYPCEYIQGKGEIRNIGKHLSKLGKKILIIISEGNYKRLAQDIRMSFDENPAEYIFEYFSGECTFEEINRIAEIGKINNCDVIAAIGGGKVIDTGKAVAKSLDGITVIVPTIASNDAPCSGLSVVYNNEGVVVKVIFSKRNPDLVLVDSEVIAKAPVRMFAAGMGDALATYFEARACKSSNAKTMARGNSTNTAIMMGKLCYDILMENGIEAKRSVEKNEVSEALENVLEANILLSGIGFESGGLAAAHAINDGFAYVEQCHGMLHGEKVAFGTIAQLILEKASQEELYKVIDFCIEAGLPVTLSDMGIMNVVDTDIERVAEAACVKTQSIKNMPFPVSEKDVYNAILKADEIGKARKRTL